ncbi:hypothetical protein FRB91_007863 [Serendipita sp. 411]|nr:hypothetical protein FRC16_004380 [Serendipita sp. 398]KAG8851452.1 hypothetical protein FRB91_007863 [Serendipita sp. 411]
MFKHAILVLSAALLTATNVLACTNAACQVANSIYKECKYSTTNIDALRKCLCTDKFIVNYNRCLNGFVCAWDGNPSTLNQPCIALYCPGTFDGGFDAIAFCRGTLSKPQISRD